MTSTSLRWARTVALLAGWGVNLQCVLSVPIVIGAAVGAVGALGGSWRMTLLGVLTLALVWLSADVMIDPMGVRVMFKAYILRSPPAGMMYHHTW